MSLHVVNWLSTCWPMPPAWHHVEVMWYFGNQHASHTPQGMTTCGNHVLFWSSTCWPCPRGMTSCGNHVVSMGHCRWTIGPRPPHRTMWLSCCIKTETTIVPDHLSRPPWYPKPTWCSKWIGFKPPWHGVCDLRRKGIQGLHDELPCYQYIKIYFLKSIRYWYWYS